MEIIVAPDSDTLAERTASLVADELSKFEGPTTLALGGGSTPRATHAALVTAPVDWSDVTVWLGDERWVDPDHEDSNAAMARSTLTDAVGAELLAPDTTTGDPAAAASRYEALLTERWAERDGVRGPDVVMLGMGDDGHTASLFPDTPALDLHDARYAANWVAAKDVWRLTATFPLLWAARHVIFLVAGTGKAEMIHRILDQGAPYPAQRVAAGARRATWMLDEPAASLLRARS